MEPIVSPLIIYSIHLLVVLHNVALAVTIISLFCLGFILLCFVNGGFGDDKGTVLRYGKIVVIIFIISSVLAIFVPTKETLYTMLITSYVTPDNIHMTQSSIVDFVKQISAAVSQVSQ